MWATVCVYVHSCTSATQGHSLWVHEAHHDMMCAYVTLRGLIDYYIRDGRESSLSVCVI